MVQLHRLTDLIAAQASSSRPYLEFLRVDALSAGVYVLQPGAVDGQSPHEQDEIYIVMAGRSRFTAGDETRDVAPRDAIYVPARLPHRFHDITEELQLIVLFAPPEAPASG